MDFSGRIRPQSLALKKVFQINADRSVETSSSIGGDVFALGGYLALFASQEHKFGFYGENQSISGLDLFPLSRLGDAQRLFLLSPI